MIVLGDHAKAEVAAFVRKLAGPFAPVRRRSEGSMT